MTATPGTLVFSHANSYPAGCYRVLIEHWRDAGWRVEALDRFGHDPRYPVKQDWRGMRGQLIDFIERDVQPDGPVVLVGHSLGGLVSLLVACRRPELVKHLVLLDSPVVAGWRAALLAWSQLTGLVHRVPPAAIAAKRRHSWPDRAAVRAHFLSKPMFARWDARVLDDYIACGFEERGGETRLRFEREVESRIYATLPAYIPRLLKRYPPRCPIDFFGGTDSAELRQAGSDASRALVGERFHWVEGGHLFPFEKPDETASRVLAALAATGA